jgi:hypothetical protein
MILADREPGNTGAGWREWIKYRAVAEHVAEIEVVRGGEVVV